MWLISFQYFCDLQDFFHWVDSRHSGKIWYPTKIWRKPIRNVQLAFMNKATCVISPSRSILYCNFVLIIWLILSFLLFLQLANRALRHETNWNPLIKHKTPNSHYHQVNLCVAKLVQLRWFPQKKSSRHPNLVDPSLIHFIFLTSSVKFIQLQRSRSST